MKSIKNIVFFVFLIIFSYTYTFSLELTSKDISVIRVGIIDMDRVLASYDLAKKWEENFQSFKTAKQLSLLEVERELDDLVRKKISLKTEIEQLQIQLEQLQKTYLQKNDLYNEKKTLSIEIDSGTVSTEVQDGKYEENINQLKNTILLKQKDFEEITKSVEEKKEQIKNKKYLIEEEILQYKEKIEAEIYSHLYNIIEKVAKQEKLNIVIEKSGILYGVSDIDITDKVLKLLK